MTIVLVSVFLVVPLLVWRFFRVRRVALTVIALWLGPVLFLIGFDLAMSGCANVPYTAVAGYLDCPTRAHELAYAVFGLPASLMVVFMLSHGTAALALFLAPLILGLALDLYLRRRP